MSSRPRQLVNYEESSEPDVEIIDTVDTVERPRRRQFEHHPGNWACSIYIKGRFEVNFISIFKLTYLNTLTN